MLSPWPHLPTMYSHFSELLSCYTHVLFYSFCFPLRFTLGLHIRNMISNLFLAMLHVYCTGTLSHSAVFNSIPWTAAHQVFYGISQARILDWECLSFLQGNFPPRHIELISTPPLHWYLYHCTSDMCSVMACTPLYPYGL